jgi:hypothetical protein
MTHSILQTMYNLLVGWWWMTGKDCGRIWAWPDLRTYLSLFLKGKKGKVVPVLNWLSISPWKHMGEWRYSSTVLDLDIRSRWVASSTPRPLCPWGIVPGIHWIGGWLGPRATLDAVKRDKSCPFRQSNPGRRTRSLSLSPLLLPDGNEENHNKYQTG